jgi:peptidoglycan/xylan/chitin deacetylase (PgdA/CDA1 family)
MVTDDFGIITIMYHRFEENKYPSTNIRINDFKNHLQMIKESDIKFINAANFEDELINNKNQRKLLLTIDDGYQSFYEKAWPILKESKIPFILFVSTREVGKNGYMSWEKIREIEKYDFVEIGNHSHTHEYLIDFKDTDIEQDLKRSIEIFIKELGKNSIFFSYPFGEYSVALKNIVIKLGFKYAFGQHSGVVDQTKNFYEMPRFPINEKYGETERFKTILKTLPFPFKSIKPENRYISDENNPPKVNIQFYENLKNLNNINCFSNEQDKWRNSKISFINKYNLNINLDGKFITERGRINCSLREKNGFYRWLGIQFVVKEK